MKRIAMVVLGVVAAGAATTLFVNAAPTPPAATRAPMMASVDADADAAGAAALLASCMGERKGGRVAAKCVGLLSDSCSKAEPAACYRRETGGWLVLVQDYMTRLERRYAADPKKVAQLAESQREWLADRAKRCERSGGTAGEADAAMCEMKETSRRALYLRLLADQAGVL